MAVVAVVDVVLMLDGPNVVDAVVVVVVYPECLT